MCMGVYLAADQALPLVGWDENNPGFNVTELSEYEKSVRGQFSKPYVYYLGAYTGCSCGFSPESDAGSEPSAQSREGVASYVKDALKHGPLELFVCWEGDWDKTPKEHLFLDPDDLKNNEAWFRELVLITMGEKEDNL